jgi:adenylate cyclase
MSDVPHHHRLFAEMKRRHVLRVAALYGVAGFAVLLALELLGTGFRLPVLLVRIVTAAVLLGYPVALLVAWAYERTPEGIVRTGNATSQEVREIVALPATRRWPGAILAVIGVAALAIAVLLVLL